MAPGDYAGLQANRPRRLHSGTRSFSIAFFAEPEFLLLLVKFMGRAFSPHPRFVWKIPAAFSPCAEKDPGDAFAPMVLVAPFDTKRCLRLKKPVLEGERKLIPNQPSFCARRLKKPVLGGERNRISNPPPFCAPAYEAGFRKQKKTQKSGLNNYHVTCRVKSSEG